MPRRRRRRLRSIADTTSQMTTIPCSFETHDFNDDRAWHDRDRAASVRIPRDTPDANVDVARTSDRNFHQSLNSNIDAGRITKVKLIVSL